jgi:hypothetical protein
MSLSTLVLLFAPATLSRHLPLPATLDPSGELQLERDLSRLEVLELERDKKFCVKRNRLTAEIADEYDPEVCSPVCLRQICGRSDARALEGKTYLPGEKCSGDGKLVVTVPNGMKSGDMVQVEPFGNEEVSVKVPRFKTAGSTFTVQPWYAMAGRIDKAGECANTYVRKKMGGIFVFQLCKQRFGLSLLHGCVKDESKSLAPTCEQDGRVRPGGREPLLRCEFIHSPKGNGRVRTHSAKDEGRGGCMDVRHVQEVGRDADDK